MLDKAIGAVDVYIHRSFVLDQSVTGLVRIVPTPTLTYFSLENAAPFKEALHQRQSKGREMRVLIERRGTDKPAEARVRCIDGSIMVLKDTLPFTPQEGACVQLLLGHRKKFIDAKGAEKLEKEQTVWI